MISRAKKQKSSRCCDAAAICVLAVALALISGCGTGKTRKQNHSFFTSGSREADQRASQTMAKAEQLSGSGEGAGETDVKQSSGTGGAVAEKKMSLYERLGADRGVSAIVDDVMP